MEFVRQPVPDRYTGVLRQFFYLLLREAAILDAIVHASQDASGILHGLFVANMRAAGADIGNVRSLVVSSYLEAATRAGRIFLKDECDLLTFQMLYFCTCIFRCFQLS